MIEKTISSQSDENALTRLIISGSWFLFFFVIFASPR